MIIGLGNRARQGKDTAGEAICSYFNYQYLQHLSLNGPNFEYPPAKIFKFADALYKVCRDEYGMIGKDARMLQTVGDGRRQQFGLDYWIHQITPAVEAWQRDTNGVAIFTDMRYTNEADWVKTHQGFTIQVSRVNPDGAQFLTEDRDPHFISEVQLENFNYDAYIRTKSPSLTAKLAVTTVQYLKGTN